MDKDKLEQQIADYQAMIEMLSFGQTAPPNTRLVKLYKRRKRELEDKRNE